MLAAESLGASSKFSSHESPAGFYLARNDSSALLLLCHSQGGAFLP
jgi:hypothetical protein